uniref:TRAF-type domain-containing protein n=1 Tax=Panagrellus redivivus TaxID=6233 RepID=A0A7E4VH87_PANRE
MSSVQPHLPSSSGSSKFPPTMYQEFIPAANMRPTGPRSNRPPYPFPGNGAPRLMRPPRFHYSRPMAPQQQFFVPRRGGVRLPPRGFGPQHPGMLPHFPPDFQPQQQFAPPNISRPESNEPPKECICERAETMIVCQRCGSELFGRIQRPCPAHPKRIQLMDHNECVNKHCRSIQLLEVPANATTEGS